MNKNKLLALIFLLLSLLTALLSLDSLYFFLSKKEIDAKVIKIENTKHGYTSIKLEYKRNNDVITVSKTLDNIDTKKNKLFSNVKIYYNELWKNEFIIKNKNTTNIYNQSTPIPNKIYNIKFLFF
jgi:hypothetical protein